MWLRARLGSRGFSESVLMAFRLRGHLHVRALGQCLDEIVRRHEVLRTTFASVNGALVQVIAPSMNLALPVVDLREYSLSGGGRSRHDG